MFPRLFKETRVAQLLYQHGSVEAVIRGQLDRPPQEGQRSFALAFRTRKNREPAAGVGGCRIVG